MTTQQVYLRFQRGVARMRVWFTAARAEPVETVNVADIHRKRVIVEAERGAAADRQSKILRISVPPLRVYRSMIDVGPIASRIPKIVVQRIPLACDLAATTRSHYGLQFGDGEPRDVSVNGGPWTPAVCECGRHRRES
jgi:hypothetical protein